MPPKRVQFTQAEVDNQLHQLGLYSSLELQLAPLILNIHRSQQQHHYLDSLNQFVQAKEAEIQQVCIDNYQDFVQSVSSLLRVRQGTVSLKHRVVELNDQVQLSGRGVADKKRELVQMRRVGSNIDEAIDTIQACLRVLDMASKVSSLIRNRKFFSALRQLEDLQQTHLKPILHYPFASLMLTSIPSSRNEIRDSVTKSLKAWMYEARNASQAVGRGALDAMEARGRRWNARKRKEGSVGLARVNGPIELGVSERHEFNVLDNDNVKVDFKPLYQCIHIYETLDALPELQSSYQSDRRAQAYLLLSTPSTLSPFSQSALQLLLEEIVGFFLIESHVVKTTKYFRSEQDVQDLWSGMCESVVRIVDTGLRGAEDPEIFLETKFAVLTFVQTLEGYGYSVNQLNSLLLTLFERYSELLQRKFSGDFEQIVLDDDHQSMVVNDGEEFEKVVSVSWLPSTGEWSANELKLPGFPLALPFSQTYPLCCIDIRSFTEQYYQFSEGFAEHHRDIDDVLRKALDNLLIKQVSENIQRRLQMINNLSQLSQIVVNVLFFQTACKDLETLLVTLRATQRGGTIHLDSLASFRRTMQMTQDRIVSHVGLRIDTFFEDAQYNWEAPHPPIRDEEEEEDTPTGYLVDLTEFLSTVMMSVLIQLPEFAKNYVYRGALMHCANVLISYLVDRYPLKINDNALLHLARDVKWLIAHVQSLENDRLSDIFQELSQTLSLLLATADPTLYLNNEYRHLHYAKVDSKKVQVILVKMLYWLNSSAPSGPNTTRRRMALEELSKGLISSSGR